MPNTPQAKRDADRLAQAKTRAKRKILDSVIGALIGAGYLSADAARQKGRARMQAIDAACLDVVADWASRVERRRHREGEIVAALKRTGRATLSELDAEDSLSLTRVLDRATDQLVGDWVSVIADGDLIDPVRRRGDLSRAKLGDE